MQQSCETGFPRDGESGQTVQRLKSIRSHGPYHNVTDYVIGRRRAGATHHMGDSIGSEYLRPSNERTLPRITNRNSQYLYSQVLVLQVRPRKTG